VGAALAGRIAAALNRAAAPRLRSCRPAQAPKDFVDVPADAEVVELDDACRFAPTVDDALVHRRRDTFKLPMVPACEQPGRFGLPEHDQVEAIWTAVH